MWRQTGECDAKGPREPHFDKSCSTEISPGWSGYCECSDGQKVMEKRCHRHIHLTCNDACKPENSMYFSNLDNL